ncbi:DUF7694 domain-containing protein [Microbacterium plantarum]|uniref:DUF7694 domain-containing protein n=1 Tax=Microbacterium plantarum TaxID=1816425 RepID=UPI002B47FBB7|nr:hypothetical protein [Microbacterium plantarum]WRK16136.1 hypothetical protein VC184_09400 [Microbacterium plantarum]
MSAFGSAAPGSRRDATPLWTKAPDGFWPHGDAWTASVADGQLRALRSTDAGRLHVSVSHSSRLPSWDELADARYRFMPDRMTVGQLLPPRAEWVDHHPRTLHLWELPEASDVDENLAP